MPFPFGSTRQAVAALGDAWGLAFDPRVWIGVPLTERQP